MMEEIFTEVYANNCWDVGSGPGSYASVTRDYRHFLETFMIQNSIEKIVDLGCGDWQFSKLIDWENKKYLGLDCVRPLVDQNALKYGSDHINFEYCDFSQVDSLPDGDLVIVKDVLQHWRFAEIADFLPKLEKYQFVIITNCRTEENHDLHATGYFRPLNLKKSPFFLPTATLLNWDTKETQLWMPTKK